MAKLALQIGTPSAFSVIPGPDCIVGICVNSLTSCPPVEINDSSDVPIVKHLVRRIVVVSRVEEDGSRRPLFMESLAFIQGDHVGNQVVATASHQAEVDGQVIGAVSGVPLVEVAAVEPATPVAVPPLGGILGMQYP